MIYHKIIVKVNTVCSFMHSIVGLCSFSTNSKEVWRGSDQPVALLRHYWTFILSVLLDWQFLIFLLKICHRIYIGFRSGMLAGQSSTVISWSANHLEVVLALWADVKVLLEKEISISIKLVSRWKHKVLQNVLVDGCIDFRFDKTQWTSPSKRHGTPNHQFLPSSQLCIWYALIQHSVNSHPFLWWPSLWLWGVNDYLLHHCEISNPPHYCDFKEQEIHGIYTVNGHLMKFKCKYFNILRYWIFDFHEL